MRAKGTLQPVIKQEVFAPMPGEVIERQRRQRRQGESGRDRCSVCGIRTWKSRRRRSKAQYNAAQESLSSVMQQLTSPNSGLTPQERVRLEAERAKLRPKSKSSASS